MKSIQKLGVVYLALVILSTVGFFAVAQIIIPAGSAGKGSPAAKSDVPADYGTNLWLEVAGISNGQVYLNLHNATNTVYAVCSTTNLMTPFSDWQVEAEAWQTNGEVEPVSVPTQNRGNLFLRAEDWTGVLGDGGIPFWWYWFYFGRTDLLATNLDCFGNTLWFDYTNNINPNNLSFRLLVTNLYVNTSSPVLSLIFGGGTASDMAVLVNDANQADAVWQPFNTNAVVYLDAGDGSYNVQVGLRESPGNPNQVWQSVTLILDTVPPILTVTNLPIGTVSQSPIQLSGCANEPLCSLTYDVSNATSVITNQTGYLTGLYFDDILWAYTTNYFQCPAINLADGANIVTLHATDLAGNTTSESLMVNFAANTNSPALNVIWPMDGTQISGNNFTLQAQTDDNTSTVSAVITDDNGNTNTVAGIVEQNGTIWVCNLPLATGADQLTLTVENTTGSSTMNLTVYQSSVLVMVAPLAADQLNQTSVTVIGTVSDPTVELTVNGVTATVNPDGTWEADGVPVSAFGTAIMNVEAYAGNTPSLALSQPRFALLANTPAAGSLGSYVSQQPQPANVGIAHYRFHNTRNQTTVFCVYPHVWYTGIQAPIYQPGEFIISLYSDDNTVNWMAGVGGTQHDHGYNDNIPGYFDGWQEFGPNPDDASGASGWLGWENASDSDTFTEGGGDQDGYNTETGSWSKEVQTEVAIMPAGQEPVGQTNLYLVQARAWEPVDPLNSLPNLPLPPEWLQINRQTLVNSGITNDDGSVWGATTVLAPAGVTTDVTPTATSFYLYNDNIFDVQALDITHIFAVDNNRDGQIVFDGSDDTTPAKPFRFWINDSKEHGDDETSNGAEDQIPGQPAFQLVEGDEFPCANYAHNQINGRSDLVNYFPVALNLSNVLQWLPPTNGFEYHLIQNDSAVKFVYTSLTPTNAFDYLTNLDSYGYGTNADEWVTNADSIQVQNIPPGVELDANWLAQVQQNNGGQSVILVEGCAATKQPLWLEIWHKDQFGNNKSLGGVPLYLSITNVEAMFRHLNFCYINGTVQVPPRPDAPNEPPTANDKNFVFLHGYNVNQQEARGVLSEVFKRMYWSGSKAKFYGVTWNGAESKDYDSIQVLPQNLRFTPDFHTNVANALDTTPAFANFLTNLPGQTVVAAHSLGNMVVLSAISDYSAAPSKFFMLDAAVPIEAVQSNVTQEPDMVYSTWQQYSNRLYASCWWQLFTNDYRSTLTWSNRLGNLDSVDVYNFYSSGEEVLRWDPVDPPAGILSGAMSELLNYWIEGVPFGTYAWVWQEKGKGAAAHDWFIGSTHGGWKFNDYWGNPPPSPAIMNDTAASTLQNYPMFSVGSTENGPPDQDLLSDEYGSAYAQAHRDRILSDAIPALTLPVGANPVPKFSPSGQPTKNFDLQSYNFQNGWPAERGPVQYGSTDAAGEWHHSDFGYVAYPFTHTLFDQIVYLGDLK